MNPVFSTLYVLSGLRGLNVLFSYTYDYFGHLQISFGDIELDLQYLCHIQSIEILQNRFL